MPPKETKGKDKKAGSKKTKSNKILPDVDELYLQSLDETHYMSIAQRESITAIYMRRINAAVKAFTVAQPPIEAATLLEREEHMTTEILTSVPMEAVPHIIRAVGLNPTSQQILQMGWIVFAGLPQVEEQQEQQQQEGEEKAKADHKSKNKTKNTKKKNKNDRTVKGEKAAKPRASSMTEAAVRQMVADTTRDMRLDEAMRAVLLPDTAQEPLGSIPDMSLMADRKKLDTLLLRLLHTGLLVYDPLLIEYLPAAHANPQRTVSVVQRGTEEAMDDVFDVLWSASRRGRASDGTRCITTEELRHELEVTSAVLAGVEPALTPEELNAFIYFVCDTGLDLVREDTFALTGMCGC